MNDFHHAKISLGSVSSEWDFTAKRKLSETETEKLLKDLQVSWQQLSGIIADYTYPIGFSGSKSRKLIVKVTGNGKPPWGGWDYLGHYPHNRRHFTRLRAQINEQLKSGQHEIDHIDFVL